MTMLQALALDTGQNPVSFPQVDGTVQGIRYWIGPVGRVVLRDEVILRNRRHW